MDEYQIIDEDGNEWIGVKPIFNEDIYKINSKRILVQGYMFPLEQSENRVCFIGAFSFKLSLYPYTFQPSY